MVTATVLCVFLNSSLVFRSHLHFLCIDNRMWRISQLVLNLLPKVTNGPKDSDSMVDII